MDNSELTVFIYKQTEDVLGFCATRKTDIDSIELAGIIVRQDNLGKGIGTSLFETAKKDNYRMWFRRNAC